MAEGASAEVGLIGREGLVGAMQLLEPTPNPSQAFLQMEAPHLECDLKTYVGCSQRQTNCETESSSLSNNKA